ncbi:hypothetical protein [Streptomyces sp. WMMC940]|nr:hypothetical protein [Streptomyces sp. WMMC940]MCZ7459818.1 hypothetical protein [Streptomyces sp. WMMC940]
MHREGISKGVAVDLAFVGAAATAAIALLALLLAPRRFPVLTEPRPDL